MDDNILWWAYLVVDSSILGRKFPIISGVRRFKPSTIEFDWMRIPSGVPKNWLSRLYLCWNKLLRGVNLRSKYLLGFFVQVFQWHACVRCQSSRFDYHVVRKWFWNLQNSWPRSCESYRNPCFPAAFYLPRSPLFSYSRWRCYHTNCCVQLSWWKLYGCK